MSPPALAAALTLPAAPSTADANVVSLAAVQSLDAGVLSSLVRTHGRAARSGSRIRIVNATPDVARMLSDLGLGWMLETATLPDLVPANEPMRRHAA